MFHRISLFVYITFFQKLERSIEFLLMVSDLGMKNQIFWQNLKTASIRLNSKGQYQYSCYDKANLSGKTSGIALPPAIKITHAP